MAPYLFNIHEIPLSYKFLTKYYKMVRVSMLKLGSGRWYIISWSLMLFKNHGGGGRLKQRKRFGFRSTLFAGNTCGFFKYWFCSQTISVWKGTACFYFRICPSINMRNLKTSELGVKPVSRKPRVQCSLCSHSFVDKHVLKRHVSFFVHFIAESSSSGPGMYTIWSLNLVGFKTK
jgi:hypothetical protein